MLRISGLSGMFLSTLMPTKDSQQEIQAAQTNKGRATKGMDHLEVGYLVTLPDKLHMPDEIPS